MPGSDEQTAVHSMLCHGCRKPFGLDRHRITCLKGAALCTQAAGDKILINTLTCISSEDDERVQDRQLLPVCRPAKGSLV